MYCIKKAQGRNLNRKTSNICVLKCCVLFSLPMLCCVNMSLTHVPSCCCELGGRDRKFGANGESREYQPVIYFYDFWNVIIELH